MKLSKHQKKVVDSIIAGKVFDIPSYLKEFKKCHLRKYDLTRPLAKFEEEEGGKQYKVIVDEDKFYIKTENLLDMRFRTVYTNILTPRKLEDIPDDAWEYKKAELNRNIKLVEEEYKGETFQFDFVEKGVNVADDFNDIIDFISLWSYLRQESLVLEVSRDINADDLGVLFELMPRKQKPEITLGIQWDNLSDSSVEAITSPTEYLNDFNHFAPIRSITSYMDEEWIINREHLKNCEEYIGRKILPTGKLKTFKQQLYTTSNEWQYRIPLIISIAALIVSFFSIIPLFFPSEEAQQLTEISQQITIIEQSISKNTTLDDVGEIKGVLLEILEELRN